MDRLQDILTFDDYEEVFTPGAPVEKSAFFFGRERELDRLEKLLRRPGFHPVIIGDRGVGKTSLVRQAFSGSELPSIRVTCNSAMTFDSFARAALRRLGVDVAQTESEHTTEKAAGGKGSILGIGGEASAKRSSKLKRKQIGSEQIDPWRFFVEMRDLDRKVVVVLDEYDVVAAESTEFHRSIAELIKTLADNRDECDSRIVIVGIAQSAEVLLGKHESIERSVKELYLADGHRRIVDGREAHPDPHH